MRPKGSLLFVLCLLAVMPARAQGQAECEPAVDMADSNDAINRMSDCDYSDQGLSGWLAGMGRSKEGTTESKPIDAEIKTEPGVAASGEVEPQLRFKVEGIVDGLEYVQQRFTLVQLAAQQCLPQGATLIREFVRQQDDSLTLHLQFSCSSAL